MLSSRFPKSHIYTVTFTSVTSLFLVKNTVDRGDSLLTNPWLRRKESADTAWLFLWCHTGRWRLCRPVCWVLWVDGRSQDQVLVCFRWTHMVIEYIWRRLAPHSDSNRRSHNVRHRIFQILWTIYSQLIQSARTSFVLHKSFSSLLLIMVRRPCVFRWTKCF